MDSAWDCREYVLDKYFHLFGKSVPNPDSLCCNNTEVYASSMYIGLPALHWRDKCVQNIINPEGNLLCSHGIETTAWCLLLHGPSQASLLLFYQ